MFLFSDHGTFNVPPHLRHAHATCFGNLCDKRQSVQEEQPTQGPDNIRSNGDDLAGAQTGATEQRDTASQQQCCLLGCFNAPQSHGSDAEDGDNQEHKSSVQATKAKTDSQVNTWETLALGKMSQGDSKLKYTFTFYDPQFHFPKSPVVGWYSPSQCMDLQTNCVRKILNSQGLDTSLREFELHAGLTFKALLKQLPQAGTKQVFVSGAGWPDLTEANVLMTPVIPDTDILKLLQRSVMLSLCDCLIITIREIDRRQLQSLLQMLILAKRNRTTVMIFHYVGSTEDFEVWATVRITVRHLSAYLFQAQHQLIEDCLPVVEVSHITGDGGDCSSESIPLGFSASSRKMKLFHFSGIQEEAFSNVQRYIESIKFLDLLSGKHCQDNMQKLFLDTLSEFAKLANLAKLVDIKEEPTADGSNGSSQLTATITVSMKA